MSILKVIGAFIAKEANGAEKAIAAVGAFLKKEEPAVQKIVDAAVADYKALQAAMPVIESDLQVVATLIADLLAAA